MKKFTLQIPEPCNEDWGKMTPNERGRFCASCAKTVVDFTKMNKNEITDYFLSNKNVCGNIKESQLQQTYGKPSFLYETVRRVAIVAGLSLVGLPFTYAQDETIQIEQVEPTNNEKKATSSCETEKDVTSSLQGRVGGIQAVKTTHKKGKMVFKKSYGRITVSGIIYEDEEKTKPLANAQVSFEDGQNAVQTDEKGRFVLRGEKTQKKYLTIQIVKYGYDSHFETYKIKRKQDTLSISESLPVRVFKKIVVGRVVAK